MSPGFTGDFAEYLAQKFPTSTAADFAILEAGVTSEETYVEQGLYWSTGHLPMLEYVAKTYKPDLLMVGMPTTDEFQHQFLGLVIAEAAERRGESGLRRRRPQRCRRRPRRAARGLHPGGLPGSRQTLTLARSLVGRDPTTFVASDHGFAPQFLAIDGSKPLVDLGLLAKPQTSNCRTATGETDRARRWPAGPAARVQIYLNLVGRDPDRAAVTPDPGRAEVVATVDARSRPSTSG